MVNRYKTALTAARLAIEVAIEQCLDERDVAELEYIHTRLTELLDGQ